MIKLYAPTYKRPGIITTHRVMPFVTYVVCESQIDSYRKKNPSLNYWVVPDSAQGNTSRIRNYILDHSETPTFICVDDDVREFGSRESLKNQPYTPDQIEEFFDYAFDIASQFDVHFFGLNPAGKSDFGAYRAYTPFSFRAFCGGPFQGHLSNPCRYDENIPLKEDYDMTLQVIYRFHKLLRFNMMYIENDFQTLLGGCQSYRNTTREAEQFRSLQKKWGTSIVTVDNSFDAAGHDFNPILKIPKQC
jgi:hypothetical protein